MIDPVSLSYLLQKCTNTISISRLTTVIKFSNKLTVKLGTSGTTSTLAPGTKLLSTLLIKVIKVSLVPSHQYGISIILININFYVFFMLLEALLRTQFPYFRSQNWIRLRRVCYIALDNESQSLWKEENIKVNILWFIVARGNSTKSELH